MSGWTAKDWIADFDARHPEIAAKIRAREAELWSMTVVELEALAKYETLAIHVLYQKRQTGIR